MDTAPSSTTVAELQQPPSTESSTTPLTSQLTSAPQTVESAASSVLNTILDEVSFATRLASEKARVQGLINKLVTRVSNPDTNTTTITTPTAHNPSENPFSASATGPVPPLDYRPRRLPGVPLDWTQTNQTVTLNLRVPPWVTKRNVVATFNSTFLSVRIKSQDATPLAPNYFFKLERSLYAPIDPDGCMWALEGDANASTLLLELEKASPCWWGSLFESDDPSKYIIVDPAASSTTAATSNAATPAPSNTVADPTTVASMSSPVSISDAANGHAETGNTVPEEVVDLTLSDVSRKSSNVDSAVSSVVDSMVTAASAALSSKATAARAAGGTPAPRQTSTTTVEDAPVEDDDDNVDEIEPAPKPGGKTSSTPTLGRKVLTRADLPKIIEESKAALSKGGPHAAEAAVQLGTFYHYGIGVEQDDAEAARLYKQGLENGAEDASAAFQLGLIYNQGAIGVRVDAAQAVRWWLYAARLGNAVAMFNLGVMLMNGSGCDMDPIAAMHWFSEAKRRDGKLEPPALTRAQMEQRMIMANKIKKERARRSLPPEEWKRRKEEALETVKWLGYTTVGLIGVGVSVMAVRYWMRNRL